MPPGQIDLQPFVEGRRRMAAADAALATTADRLTRTGAEITALVNAGAADDRIAAARDRLAALQAEHARHREDLDAVRDRLRDLSDGLLHAVDPATLVEGLDGRVPVALLPVRLETRFGDDGRTLQIRVYPDQVHLDAHEPELTDEEAAAGHAYWAAVTAAGGDADARDTAWRTLTGGRGATRARWVAEATHPDRDDEVPTLAGEWRRAIEATALPDRWVFVGHRDGREVLRVWGKAIPDRLAASPTPDPTVDHDAPPDDASPDDVPVDDPMRWVVDFGAAEDVGMAVTVHDGQDGVSLVGGLDRLTVIGVDWTLPPTDAAARLDTLLAAHRYTDGLSFPAAGSPTNNTAGTRAAAVPVATPPAGPGHPRVAHPADSAAVRLTAALGADPATFDGVAGADATDRVTARAAIDVLWPATLGHYLDELMDPVVDDDTIARVRQLAVDHLAPGGPLPALRIGKQPYGVLPVVGPGYTPHDAATRQVWWLLGKLRSIWEGAAGRQPRFGDGTDPDDTLLALLQRGPLAATARFRRVLGPAVAANTKGLENEARVQGWLWALWGALLGWSEAPRLAEMVADTADHPLPVPWVQDGELGDGVLTPNYLAAIAAALRSEGGRAQLVAEQGGDTLLHALAAYGAVEELDRAAARLVAPFRDDPRPLPATATRRRLFTDELVGIRPEPTRGGGPAGRDRVVVTTPAQQAQLVLPPLTGGRTVADHLAGIVAGRLPHVPAARTLQEYLASLDTLSQRPAAEIDRAVRGWIDAVSHRLDAWYTALADERLAAQRAAGHAGVHVGGFGWVDDLRPDPRPDSLGYVHAPSIPHAATAAILRSGRLSHQGEDGEALDIQLSSARVRLALPLIEGVAAGQPLPALLGYRFERSLKEEALTLARFILPFRRLAPLRGGTRTAPTEPVETVAARDVADGVRLLERWEHERATLLGNVLGAALHGVGAPTAGEREQLAALLDRLAALYDAVADVLMAETVHQTVLGNYERAGAALAALDRQERPPDPQVVRTPRTGLAYTQRVLALTADTRPAAPWDTAPLDTRARCAPRVNAWVASLLPPPDTIRFGGRVVDDADGSEQPVAATAADLGLSPIGLVAASAAGAGDRPSGLEERVALALTAGVALSDTARLEVIDDPPADAPGAVGLGALRVLLGWIRDLLGDARPATAADLAPVEHPPATGIDLADLAARSDLAVAALDEALARLADAAANPTLPKLEAALRRAAETGAEGTVPLRVLGGNEARRAALVAQCATLQVDLTRRRARVTALDDGFAGTADPAGDPTDEPTDDQVVAYRTERLRTVLGAWFPVWPAFRLAPPAARRTALDASLADAAALTDGDGTAVRSWLDRLGTVRPGVDRLARTLTAAELLGGAGGGATACHVAQLPHTAGQRWLALPFPESGPADARVALALHAPTGVATGALLAGVVCDEWQETVPADTETTGLTFHYDAPGARAPQTLLLAVPPDPAQVHWTLDGLLAVVDEARSLARLRGVAPQDLRYTGGLLPATYLPHNPARQRPSVDLFTLADTYLQTVVHATVIGKGISL